MPSTRSATFATPPCPTRASCVCEYATWSRPISPRTFVQLATRWARPWARCCWTCWRVHRPHQGRWSRPIGRRRRHHQYKTNRHVQKLATPAIRYAFRCQTSAASRARRKSSTRSTPSQQDADRTRRTDKCLSRRTTIRTRTTWRTSCIRGRSINRRPVPFHPFVCCCSPFASCCNSTASVPSDWWLISRTSRQFFVVKCWNEISLLFRLSRELRRRDSELRREECVIAKKPLWPAWPALYKVL